MGGNVAKVAKEDLEKKLGESVISNENALKYTYADNAKKIKKEKRIELLINSEEV